MAVELKRLIEKVSSMDITLEAGSRDLDRIVSWVHVVETVDASDFLDGGEIAITTGLGIKSDSAFLDLIKCMDSHHVAAVIVNIGPFIGKIPDCVLDYCNKNNFPLFTVPWKVHLAHIIRIMTYTITKDEQRIQETASAFMNAIFFPKQEELYITPLTSRGFLPEWPYTVIAAGFKSDDDNPAGNISKTADVLDQYMEHAFEHSCIFSRESEIICVLGNYDSKGVYGYVHEMQEYMKGMTYGKELILGVGKTTRSIRCINKSYNQAMEILALKRKGHLSPDKTFYEDMGIFKLLMAISDQEIIDEYYDLSIGKLVKYDEENETDFTEILKTYLEKNGSVKDTAEKFYVHRNTINYKLQKISEILGMDLSSMDSRLQLAVGLMIKEMR